jgi:hypothetical protein
MVTDYAKRMLPAASGSIGMAGICAEGGTRNCSHSAARGAKTGH